MWLVHRGGFSAAKRMARMTNGVSGGDVAGDAKVKVRLEHNEEVIDVDEEDVEKVRLIALIWFVSVTGINLR